MVRLKSRKITLNSNPSAEWTTAYGKTVDAKIETAVKPVRDDLAAYKTSNDAAVKNLAGQRWQSAGDAENCLL